MKKTSFFILALGIYVYLFIPTALVVANHRDYPKVQSVSPTVVHPGDTITISGMYFEQVSLDQCDGNHGRGSTKMCHINNVVAAYKAPRTHTDFLPPSFRLAFISVSPTSAQVQVPKNIPTGDGTYNLGWFWEYNPSEASESLTGGLIGFARYDTITVVGAGSGTTGGNSMPKLTVTPTSTPQPTASVTPSPTLVPTPTLTNIQKTVHVVEPLVSPIANIIRSFLTWMRHIFQK